MNGEPSEECARLVMDTIPLVMRSIGGEMHRRHAEELSMPQFVALMFLKHHRGASLSLLSRHLGTSMSSISKLIDGLVERGYASREIAPEDRRRMILTPTELGEATLESVRSEAAAFLGEVLALLSEEQCQTITEAMRLLGSLFQPKGVPEIQETMQQGEQSSQ